MPSFNQTLQRVINAQRRTFERALKRLHTDWPSSSPEPLAIELVRSFSVSPTTWHKYSDSNRELTRDAAPDALEFIATIGPGYRLQTARGISKNLLIVRVPFAQGVRNSA